MKSVTLHARSYAAGKVLKLVLILVLHPAAHRHHIADTAIVRILGSENVIEQCALVKVGIANVRLDGEEFPGHFDHVVHVAGFGRAAVHHVVQLVWLTEVFIFAVAPGGKAVMQSHFVPEICGRFVVGLIAGINVSHQGAQHFGHLGVSVLAAEDVLPTGKRIDHGAMFELAGKCKPARIPGVGVEVGGDFIHSAKLRRQHLLNLIVIELGKNGLCSAGELDFHVQGRAVAGVTVSVPQSRKDLVFHVPRRP